MHDYYTITYELKEKDLDHPGQMKDFNPCIKLYTANVGAKTADEAKSKLVELFNMLKVEVKSVSEKKSMTDEEYEKG